MTEPFETPCTDPARGEVFARSPLTREDDVAPLIARSRKAQAEWAALPLKSRLAACRRLRDHMLREADAIAAVISRDNGKTRVDAMSTEVFPAMTALSYYTKKARAFLRPAGLGTGNLLLINKRSRRLHHPWGVIGVISPWNYPRIPPRPGSSCREYRQTGSARKSPYPGHRNPQTVTSDQKRERRV